MFILGLFPTKYCRGLVFGSAPPGQFRLRVRLRVLLLSHITLSHTTLSHTNCHTQLCHIQVVPHDFVTYNFVTYNFVTHNFETHNLSHTQLCHWNEFVTHTQTVIYNFVTHNFVTHNFVTYKLSHTTLSHTTLSHTTLSHTIFHIQLVTHTQLSHTHTQMCQTHKLSHTTLSHTTLSHTQIVTHNFVTYKLSHTTSSHTTLSHTTLLPTTLSHTTLSQTTLSHTIFHTHPSHPPTLCVAGVALGDIYLRFTWQAWHLATSTFVSRGKLHLWDWAGSGGVLGRRGAAALSRSRRGTWRHPPSFHVAGLALGDIHLRFTWQAWRLWDWAGSGGALGRRGAAALSRGRRGTWRHPPSFHVAGGTWRQPPSFHVAGVALMGLGWVWWRAWPRRAGAILRVAGVALWRHPPLRGRRGTWRHPPSFHVAGVALMGLGWVWWRAWAPWRRGTFAWQVWHLATSTFVSRGRRGTNEGGLGVAGVALGDIVIYLRFTWQAWHLATSTFVSRGRPGTWRHPPSFRVAGVAIMGLGWLWWRAWALGRRGTFAWQVWHLATSTFVSRGRLGDIHLRG